MIISHLPFPQAGLVTFDDVSRVQIPLESTATKCDFMRQLHVVKQNNGGTSAHEGIS